MANISSLIMPTEFAAKAASLVRDPSHFQWYVLPIFFFVAYVYASEIEKRNWSAVLAALTFFGLDWIYEIANGLVFHFTNHAPVWGTPGSSAYVVLIGLSIELMFMFAMVGFVWVKLLPADKNMKILGVPNRLFIGMVSAAFAVFIERMLNSIDALTWDWPWWNREAPWLIYLLGYFPWFMILFWVYDMPKMSTKLAVVGTIWAVVIASLAIFIPLGWI